MQLEKARRVPAGDAQGHRIVAALRREGDQGPGGGCLAGAEIARTERYLEGRLPSTRSARKSTTASAEARTTYGVIGVKVWINRGESREVRLADDARR